MAIRDMSLRAEGEAISKLNIMILDCFVASLLAMTINWLPRNFERIAVHHSLVLFVKLVLAKAGNGNPEG